MLKNRSGDGLRELNWLGDDPFDHIPDTGIDVEARIRSTGIPQTATLMNQDGAAFVHLHEGEDGVSPGQACVFYDGTRVLGGGWITRTEPDGGLAANGTGEVEAFVQSAPAG